MPALLTAKLELPCLDVFVKRVGFASLALLTAKLLSCLATAMQPLPGVHPCKVLHHRDGRGAISSLHACAAFNVHVFRSVHLRLLPAVLVHCRTSDLCPRTKRCATEILQAFKDYDLEQHRIFDEEDYKSRAIVAHGTASRTILVAFRGTNSIRNLHLDLRGWPTVWPRHRCGSPSPPQPPQ